MDQENIHRDYYNNFNIFFMETLAWIVLILNVVAFVFSPLMIGKDRGEYTYVVWVGQLVGAIATCLLALRVLGKI